MSSKNYILGGGLIALLARDILGGDWTIIPMGRSMFYSLVPPLADDFIAHDDSTAQYIHGLMKIPIIHKTMYSCGGQLVEGNNDIIDDWLDRYYNGYTPQQAKPYWKHRGAIPVYYGCSELYKSLQLKYKDEIIRNNEKFGKVSKIEDHAITTTTGLILEYDNILNTIPLYALLERLGIDHKYQLKSRDAWFYHVRTKDLDLESASTVLVVDNQIEFVKATKVNDINYIFEAPKRIEMPGEYFMAFMTDFELVGETVINRAVPCGNIPKIFELDNMHITNVGSLAVWDDCLDVGSCIKRLIKHGHKASR